MQRSARRGDLCTGHDACAPRPAQRGSATVTINDRAALRVSDPFVPHGCPSHSAHPGKVAQGSSTVTFDDLPAARIGDAIDCGGAVQLGSPDVFVGD
jgi:uncharacterized Zn-binding protein involved in type VI secretion